MSRRYAIVRIVLGVLLLAAAGLKLYGLSVSAVPRVGWFAQPWVQLAAVEWELVLGLWLVSGAYPVGSWLAALGTFLGFAGVSGYLGWVGVASCGCFGTIHASPWHVFAVDLAALLALVLCPPERQGANPGSPPAISQGSAAGWVLGSAVVALLGLTGLGTWVYGSPAQALARLRGDVVTVESGYVDFGVGEPRQVLETRVRVRNWSDRPVRLVGGTSDCSCITTQELPKVIQPSESLELAVFLRVLPSGPGLYERNAEIWTDDPRAGRVPFRAACLIRPPDRP
jgi:hypothetical protein